MKYILSLLLTLGFSLQTFADCTVKIDNKFCINIEWTEGPYIDAYSTNIVLVTSLADGNPINLPGEFKFYSWMIMDMHEHGGTDFLTVNSKIGNYESDEIYFFSGMNGTWQFKMNYNGKDYVLENIEE